MRVYAHMRDGKMCKTVQSQDKCKLKVHFFTLLFYSSLQALRSNVDAAIAEDFQEAQEYVKVCATSSLRTVSTARTPALHASHSPVVLRFRANKQFVQLICV